MRAALDSNILAYAEAAHDEQRTALAIELIRQLPDESTVVAAQALGELFNVLTRKLKRTRVQAREAARKWGAIYKVLATSAAALDMALDLAAEHRLSIWDAVQLAVAAEARCDVFISEDLQSGFRWHGVTVVNPFVRPLHPLLEALLDQD